MEVVVLGAVVFVLEVPQADCANRLESSFKSKSEEKTVGCTLFFLIVGETNLDPALNSSISPRLEFGLDPRAEKPWVKINNTTRGLFSLVTIFDMRMGGKIV